MWGLGGSGVVDLLDEAVVSEADARRKLRFGRSVIHLVAQVGEQGPFGLEVLDHLDRFGDGKMGG